MNYFVTAIGTDSGKTLLSAILAEALGADYWKPVQAGKPADSDTVHGLIKNGDQRIHPEAYFLNTPASPHAAAAIDGITISLDYIVEALPSTRKDLVIEGAGGILVPLNQQDMVIDIARRIPCKVILVCDLYLGSINHTLLSVSYLKNIGLPVAGIIFNGPANPASEAIILAHSGYPCLLRLPKLDQVTPQRVQEYAAQLRQNL